MLVVHSCRLSGQAQTQAGADSGESGSILVMAVVLSFATIVLGVAFLGMVDSFQKMTDNQIAHVRAFYNSFAGLEAGNEYVVFSRPGSRYVSRWFSWERGDNDNSFRFIIDFLGNEGIPYGVSSGWLITGEGSASYPGRSEGYRKKVRRNYSDETYADFLYLSNKERDPVRNDIVRFWTPDTLDGKVHSNDTIHISYNYNRPVFEKRVTTSAGYIDPPYNNGRFDEDWGYRPAIVFPDQAYAIRANSGYRGWGTSTPDSATEITFSGPYMYVRYCGPYFDGQDTVERCLPYWISEAPRYPLPITGALFVEGKVYVKASRGRPDRTDSSFISEGFEGKLTLASSDTMIITDNLIYKYANPDNSVPSTVDSISDVLGLISENYIMIGANVGDTVYVNAAMAAINGAITVQDIYRYNFANEKQSLFIYGSLAQRNRGLVHTSYNIPPDPYTRRGFIEKDYHYDKRLADHPPPFFLPTGNANYVYEEDFFEGGGP